MWVSPLRQEQSVPLVGIAIVG